jgi:hypothetical protein
VNSFDSPGVGGGGVFRSRLVGAIVVPACQCLLVYAAIRLTSGVPLPIRRGYVLLLVLVFASALGSLIARSLSPHGGSGYAITLGAMAAFVGAYAIVAAWIPLKGLAVLVPAFVGSFIAVFLLAGKAPSHGVTRREQAEHEG